MLSGTLIASNNKLPEGWVMLESKANPGKFYFHYTPLGLSQWHRPTQNSGEASSILGQKRERDDSQSKARRAEDGTESQGLAKKIAIIVPFRDLDKNQQRQQHLNIFIPSLTRFLTSTGQNFCLYIIEQSDDRRKFNRGKLLNIGFEYAAKDGCDLFIFHDVDLIPSCELIPWYTTIPVQPAHVARVWNRYSLNPSYFGGVVAFSEEQFRKINGFPNTFWGWGGEDDEMMLRVQKCQFKPVHPSEGDGTFLDLEENTLEQKVQFLKSNDTLKCMNKVEVLAEHAETWTFNGLSTMTFRELSVKRVPADAGISVSGSVKIQVDVCLNNHWTDLVCSNDDMQRKIQPNQAKVEWTKSRK